MEINILDLGGRRILEVTRSAIAGILNSKRLSVCELHISPVDAESLMTNKLYRMCVLCLLRREMAINLRCSISVTLRGLCESAFFIWQRARFLLTITACKMPSCLIMWECGSASMCGWSFWAINDKNSGMGSLSHVLFAVNKTDRALTFTRKDAGNCFFFIYATVGKPHTFNRSKIHFDPNMQPIKKSLCT
jgi:hypothetical protein